jgi:LPS sulfotransferase NodH
MAVASLLGAYLVLQVPEGGSPWMYLLLAGAVCAGAFAFHARKRADECNNN